MNELDPTIMSTEFKALERVHAQEAKFERKAQGRLTKKLNRSLGLPRDAEHDWALYPVYGRTSVSWKDFYKGNDHTVYRNRVSIEGDSNQVAITATEDKTIAAQLVHSPDHFSLHYPNFKLLPSMPTAEELFEARSLDVLPGRYFSDIESFGRAIVKLS